MFSRPYLLSFPLALVAEGLTLWRASVMTGFRIPIRMTSAAVKSPNLASAARLSVYLDAVGDAWMEAFDDLGPLYGKTGQILLSRLPADFADLAETLRLTRLFGKWRPLPFKDIGSILDEEVPEWNKSLVIESEPLGVASMAQVHAAVDQDGKKWVVKVLKPQAVKRLSETLSALESLASQVQALRHSPKVARLLEEFDDLSSGLRKEMSLNHERETILKVHERFGPSGQGVLRIPTVHPTIGSDKVLVLERFEGSSLADVVSGRVEVTDLQKQKLARGMVGELLVQVFEWGLFHADPHAGNLILCDDGTLGLFDWGLAGELTDTDRKHISSILRSIVTLDLDRLGDALVLMAKDQDLDLEKDQVMNELRGLAHKLKNSQVSNSQQKLGLHSQLQTCLGAAERLGIRPPRGLLMMAKSIITIEGLGRGLDPELPLLRIAGPILIRAARPSLFDWIKLMGRAPKMGLKWDLKKNLGT